jgi:flagellar motility protein MotE (MotC chaperone)
MRFVREFRLIPVVLIATASLAGLKLLGLMLDGGYLLADLDVSKLDRPIHVERDPKTGTASVASNEVTTAPSESTWGKWMVGLPEVTGSLPAEIQAERNIARTGSSPAPKPDAAPKPEKKVDGKLVQLNDKPAASPSERAILERLQERRQELDQRGREIELRESLLKAAEKKLEANANALRNLEASAGEAVQKKEEAEVQRLKNIVTMYENMKAKDAARIFDRLEMRILIEVASQINPRRMSDILGLMSPEAAERLTVELANRATAAGDHGVDPNSLPKIEGTTRN